jgi:hypothetical protein
MGKQIVKILNAFYITHDVKCFWVEKPLDFTFIPGQAVNVSINLPEWNDKLRPFSITSLSDRNYIEFMIKIYRDHNGVTNMLGKINAGSELILHDVFGAIQYKGPGVFIAGGTGITPFISIFRDLYKQKLLSGNSLIYSNKTYDDVIMDNELKKLLKRNYLRHFTRENTIGYIGQRIDRNFLIENIINFGQHFYICGSSDFVKKISGYLIDLGATPNSLVIED